MFLSLAIAVGIYIYKYMQKQDKILITGSTGMIGSALNRTLALQGYDNILAPDRKTLDLKDQSAVDTFFAKTKPDYVFHLAAIVGGIHANNTYPAKFYENTIMQSNVINAASRNNVKKLLIPGSACTYPKFAPQPVKESEFLNGLIEPTNLAYAGAKINGIIMAQSYRRELGLKTIIPMPTNAYGINDNFSPNASHVIPALMTRFENAKKDGLEQVDIWGSGKPLREFIFVDDVAEAFIFLMRNYDEVDIINLGTQEEISIAELAKKIADIVGYKGEVTLDTSKPDGAPRKCLDSSKLRSLGWKPKTPLDEGLKKMYEYHFKN
jgi:GDP-L-fucose synthase